MSKKDFNEYYYQIQATYLEMAQLLKQLLKSLEKGEIDEAKIESFKASMQPIANNYGFMTQVKVLLDKTTRKSKVVKLTKKQQKLIDSANPRYAPENIIKENEESIQKLKDLLE